MAHDDAGKLIDRALGPDAPDGPVDGFALVAGGAGRDHDREALDVAISVLVPDVGHRDDGDMLPLRLCPVRLGPEMMRATGWSARAIRAPRTAVVSTAACARGSMEPDVRRNTIHSPRAAACAVPLASRVVSPATWRYPLHMAGNVLGARPVAMEWAWAASRLAKVPTVGTRSRNGPSSAGSRFGAGGARLSETPTRDDECPR